MPDINTSPVVLPHANGASGDITRLLHALREGQTEALDHLMPQVYEELRRIAHGKLRRERASHTLNTTALVHEAYLRLADQHWVQLANRGHFFAIAAQAMRRILVSYARKHNAVKRGGRMEQVPLDEAHDEAVLLTNGLAPETLLSLDEAMTRLAVFNERGCRVVEYHFFGGMTYAEIADVMGISVITVRRAWALAKMWLSRELNGSDVLAPAA